MAAGPAILVIGPNWVGDMVMAHTLVQALRARFPEAPIDVLAPPANAQIAARMAEVRDVIEFDFSPHRLNLNARRTLAGTLKGRFTSAYVLPGSWISALVPALAGIPVRVGYLRELRFGLLTRIVRMPAGRRRRTAEAYARLAGAAEPTPPILRVDVANRDRLLALHQLAATGFVALLPGAEGGAAKRWPAVHFAALARRLQRDGNRVLLLGGLRDQATTAEIAAAAPGAIDLGGRTTLGDAVDIIAAAQLVVSNDSGLMHVAAAVGTPVVGIYGSTSPVDTPPLTDRRALLWRDLACSPCHRRRCPLGHTDCLRGLTVAEVAEATLGLIGRRVA